jgi:hypothetical protein
MLNLSKSGYEIHFAWTIEWYRAVLAWCWLLRYSIPVCVSSTLWKFCFGDVAHVCPLLSSSSFVPFFMVILSPKHLENISNISHVCGLFIKCYRYFVMMVMKTTLPTISAFSISCQQRNVYVHLYVHAVVKKQDLHVHVCSTLHGTVGVVNECSN